MSLQTMVVNINYFIETVLKTANSDPRWNTESFDHALKWAVFCERVVKEIRDRNLGMLLELNICLQEILRMTPNSLIVEANIGFMYHSTQVLLMVLLNNSKLPLKIFLMTIDIYMSEYRKDYEQVLYHVSKMKCKTLAEIMVRAQCAGDKVTDVWDRLAGILLLKYLCSNQHTLKIGTSCLNEGTMILLVDNEKRLHVLMSAASLNEFRLSALARKMQTFLRNWLCQKLMAKGNIQDRIWCQPPQILVAFAASYQEFLRLYVQRLFQVGDDLKPYYSEYSYTWKRSNHLDNAMKFEDLRIHLKLLLNVGGKVSDYLKEQILSKVLQDKCSVWEDLQ